MSNDASAETLYATTVFFRTFGDFRALLALDALVLRTDLTDVEKGARLDAMIQETMAAARGGQKRAMSA